MLRYPTQVESQQPILAPLDALVNQIPACEEFITFVGQVDTYMDSLSPGALQNISKIMRNMAKAFDYIYTSRPQSIYSSQYLLKLSVSALKIASNAGMAAKVATGTMSITITDAAQAALSALDAWDPAQGYPTPMNVESMATALMEGVSIP